MTNGLENWPPRGKEEDEFLDWMVQTYGLNWWRELSIRMGSKTGLSDENIREHYKYWVQYIKPQPSKPQPSKPQPFLTEPSGEEIPVISMPYYPRRGAGGEAFPDKRFLLWLVAEEGLSGLVTLDVEDNPIFDKVNEWFEEQPAQYQTFLRQQYSQYQQRQAKEVERRATILERDFPTSFKTPPGEEIPVIKWRLYDAYIDKSTGEERGIFMPLLLPNQATPENLTVAFQNLYSGTLSEGVGDEAAEATDISPTSAQELRQINITFEEFSPELAFFSLRKMLEDAQLPSELLGMPDIQDYLFRQAKLMAGGQRLTDPASVITEITKMQQDTDYINRLRARGEAEGEVSEAFQKADLQKMGALLGIFDEAEGETAENEIVRTERALEKLRPAAEEYQGLIERGLIDPKRDIWGSMGIGLGKLETYKQLQSRLAQLQSGQITPVGISKTQVGGALQAGVPITRYAGLAQQYIANPESPEFQTLSMAERQDLARAGLSAEGGGEAEDTTRRAEEARRKKIKEDFERMKREVLLAPSRRPQRIARL